MANIIREDVVKLSFDTGDALKELQKLQSDFNELKKKLSGGIDDGAFDDLKDDAKETIDPLKKVKEQADKIKQSLTDIGKKAATTAFNGLKKIAKISFKALLVSATAIAAAVGKIGYEAVQAFADFEQLKGGVETLFKDSADTVMKFANNAFKSAGLSANAYMETVTSFSASLIQSCGGDTAKAAKLADTAITDMADNANKMGTDMGSLQYAYQGFAKQNYTMLDNLKLGYGGTKEEMKRLIKDAAKIDKSVDKNSMSYGNIVKAIHAIQDEMGILGTTQKEAEKTVTGSLNAMKATWQNLLTAMGSGEGLDECMENMISSVETFAGNVMPVAERALLGMGTLVEKLAPIIAEKLPDLADKLLPPLIKATISLTKGLIKALPNIIRTVFQTIGDVLGEQFPALKGFGDFFAKHADKIAKFIPILLGLVGAFKAFGAIKSIGGLFGGKGGEGGKGGMFSPLQDLAKMKTKDVLKGMANLAIIMGGMAVLMAAFMLVSPYLAEIGDTGAFIKMALIMGAMGILGGVLAKFAGIAGKMKVSTVLKGLANMAIIIAGMSVLFLLLGALSLIKFDYGAIMAIVGIIGALGLVAGILTLFAAVCGLIPIPVVLMGLANMAIVMAGMDALYLLIGATSLIAFDLGRIIKIIGIIGLLGTVGAVLTVFAGICGLIPMPVVLAGLANIGLVLGALTGLIIAFGALSKVKGINEFIETGGALLSKVFGVIGEIAGSLISGLGEALSGSLPTIGENLGQFGKNVKPLFDLFNGVDMGGVGSFFSALALLFGSTIANDVWTGIKSIFGGGGENSFATFGTTLSEFGTNAKGFFDAVAKYPENSFTNATQMFESLSNIDKLKKATKKVDFSGIANGLGSLNKDSVKQFFVMAGELAEQDFENAKLMFETLGGLDSLPKKVDTTISEIIEKVSDLPKRMGDALKNNSSHLSNGMVEMWKAAVEESVKPVNKLLDGANHILKEFGSKKRVIEWTPYARGTGGHKGGNALVNDGRGAELVQMPNGNTFIPHGRNVFLPNAPKGMKVLSAERTARLMGKNSPTFRYADGVGNLDVWSHYGDAQGLVDKITKNISYGGLGSFAAGLGESMVTTFAGEMPAWIDKLFRENTQSISSYIASGGVMQWLPTVARALRMEGQYSAMNVARTLFQMKTESGGNPKAINLWDKNAKNGTPSKGLMQVIDPTFNAYAREGFNSNIYDPLSNVLASIRYAVSRYGSLANAYKGVGYANGVGTISMPAVSPVNLSYTPESSYTGGAAGVAEYNTYSPQFNFTISGSTDDRVLARKIKRAVKEAFDDMVDGVSRSSPKLKEV